MYYILLFSTSTKEPTGTILPQTGMSRDTFFLLIVGIFLAVVAGIFMYNKKEQYIKKSRA
ncbi:LPXTG cell wall anchor domain-containing protein [Kurthia sibirica]|uniref:Gram-positive cocci surface proteins LPxTG domain-containing protein n=1 Tax=Kurthia sibirica TaxID=202750 RepID=A0A2U3AJ22_9BACL|nr:hypothetical protein DEX24_12645 [Kurthia sibirica]